MRLEPRSNWLLLAGQAIHLTALVMAVAVGPVLGVALAPDMMLGTVPYGGQFASSMILAYPMSIASRRWGRGPVFRAGAIFLIASGVVGCFAVEAASFAGLVLAHVLLGAFSSTANFYRFAAAESVGRDDRPRAVALVIAAGAIGAVAGPLMAQGLRDVPRLAAYSAVYASLAVLGLACLGLLSVWRTGPGLPVLPPTCDGVEKAAGRPTFQLGAMVASGSVGYLVMNLLMVQATIQMKDVCSFDRSAQAIQIHVLAMFVPSFFLPWLSEHVGMKRVLPAGFVLLALAAACGMASADYLAIVSGLVLLGFGWNLTYAGASAFLSQSVDEGRRHRWQGMNDTCVAACSTVGAFLPAPFLGWFGWRGSNTIMFAMCAVGAAFCVWAFRTESLNNSRGNANAAA